MPTDSDIRAELKCPVCFEYLSPPLNQCQNGHLICHVCRQSVSECPICRDTLQTRIRSLPMESLAAKVLFPCRYNSSGCHVMTAFADKANHENQCRFSPLSCPYPKRFKCCWSGPIDEMATHLRSHSQPPIAEHFAHQFEFVAFDASRRGRAVKTALASCYFHRFQFVLVKHNDPDLEYFAFVQLLDDSDSNKFNYTV